MQDLFAWRGKAPHRFAACNENGWDPHRPHWSNHRRPPMVIDTGNSCWNHAQKRVVQLSIKTTWQQNTCNQLVMPKKYMFLFSDRFVFQHTTVPGMRKIALHHASQNSPAFLTACCNHLLVWTLCNNAESQARISFSSESKNVPWLCQNGIRQVSAMKKLQIWIAPSLYATSILCCGHFWGPEHVTLCEYEQWCVYVSCNHVRTYGLHTSWSWYRTTSLKNCQQWRVRRKEIEQHPSTKTTQIVTNERNTRKSIFLRNLLSHCGPRVHLKSVRVILAQLPC